MTLSCHGILTNPTKLLGSKKTRQLASECTNGNRRIDRRSEENAHRPSLVAEADDTTQVGGRKTKKTQQPFQRRRQPRLNDDVQQISSLPAYYPTPSCRTLSNAATHLVKNQIRTDLIDNIRQAIGEKVQVLLVAGALFYFNVQIRVLCRSNMEQHTRKHAQTQKSDETRNRFSTVSTVDTVCTPTLADCRERGV